MGSFNSTTQSNTTSTNTGGQTGTYTPTQNAQVTDFRNSLYPQIQSLMANAAKPVYGAAQQAQFTNNLNQTTNANLNTLGSTLAARTGSVNSGAYASGIQGQLAQRGAAQANYAAMVPQANQQAYMQNMTSALGLGNAVAGPALTSNTTSGTSQGNSSGTTNTSSTPSVFSDVLGVASAAMGAYTGLSGMGAMSGSGGGPGTPSYMSALQNPNPASYGAGPAGYNPTPGFTADASGYVNGFGGGY